MLQMIMDMSIQKKVQNGYSMRMVLFIKVKKDGVKVKWRYSGLNSKRVMQEKRQDGMLSIFKVMSMKLLDRCMIQRQSYLCYKKIMVQVKNKGLSNSQYKISVMQSFLLKVISLNICFNQGCKRNLWNLFLLLKMSLILVLRIIKKR